MFEDPYLYWADRMEKAWKERADARVKKLIHDFGFEIVEEREMPTDMIGMFSGTKFIVIRNINNGSS